MVISKFWLQFLLFLQALKLFAIPNTPKRYFHILYTLSHVFLAIISFIILTIQAVVLIALRSTFGFATYLPRRWVKFARELCYARFRSFRRQAHARIRRAVQDVAVRPILYLFKPRLTVFLMWTLECNYSLSQRVHSFLQVLQEAEDFLSDCTRKRSSLNLMNLDIVAAKDFEATSISQRNTSRPPTRTTLVGEVTAKVEEVNNFLFDISSNQLCTPPATPDTDYPSEFSSGTLYSTGIWSLPQIDPTPDIPTSSATPRKPCFDATPVIPRTPSPLINDPLYSLDCTARFMRTLILNEKIGEGAYGHTYRGTGKGGKLFAIKIMNRNGTLDQDAAFQEEIEAMKRAVSSEWVAKLKYWQSSDEHILLAMSLPLGGNIYDYAKSQYTLEPELAIFWTAEILVGLHSLHTLGIIHRNIKPENIMLNVSGHIKITDFSLAKLFDHDTVSKDQWPLFHSLRRTGGDLFPQIWALETNPHTTNEPFGTQGFAPPEVWQRRHYSYGVDYFAMACVLYELLTSKLPFAYDPITDNYDIMTIVVDPDYALPEVQHDFLKKALMPNPVLRPSVSHMKRHPLFKDIDWKAIARREVDPPISF